MASIFQLFGQIFIDNAEANKNIDATTKKAESAGDKVKGAFSTIAKGAAKVGTAVVGAASTIGGAAYKMANGTAQQADVIDKLSERTSINREELQRWMHACDQSGVSSDVLTSAVKTMSSTLENGSGQSAEYLERLGLSFEELNGLSTEEKFEKITEALADMEDGTERNVIGQKLLGKGYTEMIPLLNAGSDGIAALKKEADDLRIVMSEKDVKAGVKLGDTIANIKAGFNGIKNTLGSMIIPIIQRVADLIIEKMPEIQGFFEQFAPVLMDLVESIVPILFEFVETLLPAIFDLAQALIPLIQEIIVAILPIIVDLLNQILPVLIQVIEAILPILIELIKAFLPLIEAILPLIKPILDLVIALISPLLDLLKVILPPIVSLLKNIIEKILPPLQKAFEGVSKVIETVFKGAFESIGKVIENVKGIFSGIIDFIEGVFSGNWEKAWNGIKSIFSNIWEGIKNVFKIPINWIIDGLNGFIRGLNKIKIPDWVPVVGGKGINIGEIPRLRVGIDYVPYDEFPALLHRGEKVLTASEAKDERNKETRREETKNEKTVNITLNLNIENFNNNSGEDIEKLADELMILLNDRIREKGAVFA